MVISTAQDPDQAVCIYFMIAYLSGNMESPLALKGRRNIEIKIICRASQQPGN